MWIHYAEPETKLRQSSGNELVPHDIGSLSCLLWLARLYRLLHGVHVEKYWLFRAKMSDCDCEALFRSNFEENSQKN